MKLSILFREEKLLITSNFFEKLISEGIDFFCGVPDSLLKEFSACLSDRVDFSNNIIAANEGNALAIATGHYLATGKPALVYMQNSGLGNIVNPLLSLVDEEVYNIPVLLVIGWRGEPDIHDEPQHLKQGKLTIPLLETMGIKTEILKNINQITNAVSYMNTTKKPFAFIVKKDLFEKYQNKINIPNSNILTREKSIQTIIEHLKETDIVVSTTGMISRELYENRFSHEKDFLTVGAMGHASSIAFGIALEKSKRKVFCFDGDGAFLMHSGALAVIASRKPENFRHIIFNNEAHDSVGGQPTVANSVNIPSVAKAFGYKNVWSVNSIEEINSIWSEFYTQNGTNLLEIKVKKGNRKDLGRPKEKPVQNKESFMCFLKG